MDLRDVLFLNGISFTPFPTTFSIALVYPPSSRHAFVMRLTVSLIVTRIVHNRARDLASRRISAAHLSRVSVLLYQWKLGSPVFNRRCTEWRSNFDTPEYQVHHGGRGR